jgi:hypothetical protein
MSEDSKSTKHVAYSCFFILICGETYLQVEVYVLHIILDDKRVCKKNC